MKISQRIKNLVGAYPYGDRMEQFFDEASREVIADLPEHVLSSFVTEDIDTGSGVNISNRRFVRAHKDGYRATPLNTWERDRFETTQDNDGYPGFYELGNLVFVLPAGGTVLSVAMPDINRTSESESVTAIPTMLLDMIIVRSALNILDSMMMDVRDGYGISFTLPAAPAAPAAPFFSVSDIVSVAPNATTIAALPSAPVYISPELEGKPTVPNVTALDLTKKIGGVTDLEAPTSPSAPLFSYTGALASAIGTITLDTLPPLPAYTKAVYKGNLSLPSLPSLDLTKEIDGSTTLNPPAALVAPAIAFIGSQSTSALATTIASLGTPPSYIKSGSSLSFTDYSNYEGSEDPEMMASIVNKLNTELNEIQSGISDETNRWRNQNEIYDKAALSAIEQGRITLQEELSNAKSATDVDASNRARALEASIADFDSNVKAYETSAVKYRSEIERQVQTFSMDLQKAIGPWRDQQGFHMTQYAQDIQQTSDEYRGAMDDHSLEARRISEQAQINAQRVSQQAQLETNASAQNELQKVSADIQQYANELNLYSLKSSLYNVESGLVIQEYVTVLDRSIRLFETNAGVGVQRYSALVQNSRAEFEGQIAIYTGGIQRNSLQAQILAQEAAQTASLSTDIVKQNMAKDIELAFKTYDGSLNLFGHNVQLFGTQSGNIINQQRVITEATNSKLRMMNYDRSRLEEKFIKARGSFIRQQWRSRSIIIQQHVI
tara:strand:+ start:8406 stop:10568 length:2163 start_codon:yes stop_codon:yes gene_type:complete